MFLRRPGLNSALRGSGFMQETGLKAGFSVKIFTESLFAFGNLFLIDHLIDHFDRLLYIYVIPHSFQELLVL